MITLQHVLSLFFLKLLCPRKGVKGYACLKYVSLSCHNSFKKLSDALLLLLTGHLLAIWLGFLFLTEKNKVNVYSDNLQLALLADTPVKSSDCGKYVDTHMAGSHRQQQSERAGRGGWKTCAWLK